MPTVIIIVLSVFAVVCGIFQVINYMARWQVYKLLGLRGWACLVPVYNTLVLSVRVNAILSGALSIVLPLLGGLLMLYGEFQIAALGLAVVYLGAVFGWVLQAHMLIALGRPLWLLAFAIFLPFCFWLLVAYT